jgi:hypothetical protein
MHSKKSHEHFTNDKFNHHIYKMQLKKKKNKFLLNIIFNQLRWNIMLK